MSLTNKIFERITSTKFNKKWAYTLMLLLGLVALVTIVAFTQATHNLWLIFWLLNINLILLFLLGLIIGRQILSFWRDRKKGRVGTRLHTRFIFIFSFLAATPAILMAVFSTLFFYFGLQTWFNDRINTAINDSLSVAQAYLREHEQVLRADVMAMANDIAREAPVLLSNQESLNLFLETQTRLRNIAEAVLYNDRGQILARSQFSVMLELDQPSPDLMKEVNEKRLVLITNDTSDRIRALVKIGTAYNVYYLYVGRLVDGNVLNYLNSTEAAVAEYSDLKAKSYQLQIVIMLIFIAVALLLLLGAIWFGLIFARNLMKPISELISATERMQKGDLSARILEDHETGDEISELGRAFNRMANQLEKQRDELLLTNAISDQRRIFTEAILSGVSSGVIAVSGGIEHGRVTLANARACELLGYDQNELMHRKLVAIFPSLLSEQRLDQGLQISYQNNDNIERILFMRLTEESTGKSNIIVTFDDISALVSAQKKSAWADVARRVAHEIKNPLTPIQLSAERLKRKYSNQITEDKDIFEKCIETIIRQVNDIGRMVSEFSDFARMRDPVKKYESVNLLITDALILQKQAYTDIQFDYHTDLNDDEMAFMDRAQMTQVLTNLIQNAVDSIKERSELYPNTETGLIRLESSSNNGYISITCTDNGLGLPEKNRERLTEPYISTKKKGSGLGLAIVKKILEDHGGAIKLENLEDKKDQNHAFGARVIIVFLKAGDKN